MYKNVGKNWTILLYLSTCFWVLCFTWRAHLCSVLTAVFTASAAGWCCLCEPVYSMSFCRERDRHRETAAGMGLTVQTSQSLLTRRLPARPETAPAPGFHTPICHILKLPDGPFRNTHTETLLYNNLLNTHISVMWPSLCCYDSSCIFLTMCVTCDVCQSSAVQRRGAHSLIVLLSSYW